MTTSYKSDNDRINQINQMSKSYIWLDFHVSSSTSQKKYQKNSKACLSIKNGNLFIHKKKQVLDISFQH